MPIKEHLDSFESNKNETLNWYTDEIAGIRSGRVTPNLVNNVNVEHYGTRTPLNGLASINNSDARTLIVSPWDKGAMQPIEKALTEADLGVMPSVDGEIIRIVFPSLTEEAREKTIKQLHHKTEEARVRLRQARDESLKEIKKEKEQGDITEDDFYDSKEQLDKLIDQANDELEATEEKKKNDIKAI